MLYVVVHYGPPPGFVTRRMRWPTACSTASSLLVVLVAIIYWQIKEIERVISEASEEELMPLRLELLLHVSPNWVNSKYEWQWTLLV